MIDRHQVELAQIKSAVHNWKKDLQAIERTLELVYGVQPSSEFETPAIDCDAPYFFEVQKRIIPISEYKTIVLQYMTDKGGVRSAELKRYISAVVGFRISDDMISVAMKKIIGDKNSQVLKLQKGLFILKSRVSTT